VASHHVCVDASETGHRIRRAREARGWRRQDLAEALTRQRGGRRVGVRSIGRWERGETLPRDAGGAIEVVLGISLANGAGPDEVYTDPVEKAVWEDPTLGTDDQRRAFIFDLRRAKREHARRSALPPAQ
jgi:ribosome-binding protein aMBF1 (putative translation factor)